MHSPGTGESAARGRLASRTSSVATSVWQTAAPGPAYAQLLVDGEPISFLIEERFREIPREPNARELAREKREYRYQAPRTESVPTGALRIVRIDSISPWYPRRTSWFDQGKQRVESKIPKVLAAFHERAQGACLSNPREPRCPGEGTDARRAARAVAGSTAKPRNAADAPLPANPEENGKRERTDFASSVVVASSLGTTQLRRLRLG